MGPKTTPSLISKGGDQIPPPPLGGREIDTPWEIGLKNTKGQCTKKSNIPANIAAMKQLERVKYPCKYCKYEATRMENWTRHQKSAHERVKDSNKTAVCHCI